MNLWELPEHACGVIQSYDSNLPNSSLQRLRDLGFAEGEGVECIQRLPLGGPRVYRMGDSVFSLDRDIAIAVKVRTK